MPSKWHVILCFIALYMTCNILHWLHAGGGNIWKWRQHPSGIWYSWVNTFSYFLYPPAINVLSYRMKPRKHIYVKYCWEAYFKSIGMLSQIFKNHIVTVACKWCFPSASDVFLWKNDKSGGKTHQASEWVEYDFYFTEYDLVLCDRVFWFLPIVQSN